MPNLLASYMQGQRAVENNKRNKLLDMQIEDAPAQRARANKLADLQLANQQQNLDAGKFDLDNAKRKQELQESAAGLGYIISSQNPKAEAERRYPKELAQLRQQNPDLDSYSDDDFRAMAAEIRNQVNAQLGVGPAPAPKRFTVEDGPRGSKIQVDPETNERKQIIGPDNSQPAPAGANRGRYRALSPQEIAAAGLPQGSSAQIDIETGKIDVLSKKDVTNTLTPKDATVAKIKLNQIKVARQQIQNAKDRFAPLKNTVNAGPYQLGSAPSEGGRKFDKSIDSLRGSITAITRVPGVGAMSDYETRLDQSKFPERSGYESVTEQQLDDLEQQLSIIENGYKELLSGGQPQQPAQQVPQAQGGIVRVRSRAEAAQLPPGTKFQTPDGRVITRN